MKATLFILLFAIAIMANSQDIQVYHGTTGTSFIIEDSKPIGNSKHFSIKEGSTVSIRVINAHPALYKYEFITTETEIEEPEIPDISGLVNALIKDLEIQSKSEADKLHATLAKSYTIFAYPYDWRTIYKQKIKDFQGWISDAERIIANSDQPQAVDKVLNLSSEGGFIGAKKQLSTNPLFLEEDIDEFVGNWQAEVKSKDYPYNYDPDKVPESKFLMDLYDRYMITLAIKAKEIRKAYDSLISGTIAHAYTVGSKKATIRLKISARDEKLHARETGDSVIFVDVIPDYERPVVELVPLALVAQSFGGKRFGIDNGLITEEDMSNFTIASGASLNINLKNFGPRESISWGAGLGFALVDQNINNLFLNTSVNFGTWVRFGIGYGWLRTPTGLKNGLTEGSDASNIGNLDELILYTREPAIYITLVIPGLNLPLSKK